jgi:hypothetical protein
MRIFGIRNSATPDAKIKKHYLISHNYTYCSILKVF